MSIKVSGRWFPKLIFEVAVAAGLIGFSLVENWRLNAGTEVIGLVDS